MDALRGVTLDVRLGEDAVVRLAQYFSAARASEAADEFFRPDSKWLACKHAPLLLFVYRALAWAYALQPRRLLDLGWLKFVPDRAHPDVVRFMQLLSPEQQVLDVEAAFDIDLATRAGSYRVSVASTFAERHIRPRALLVVDTANGLAVILHPAEAKGTSLLTPCSTVHLARTHPPCVTFVFRIVDETFVQSLLQRPVSVCVRACDHRLVSARPLEFAIVQNTWLAWPASASTSFLEFAHCHAYVPVPARSVWTAVAENLYDVTVVARETAMTSTCVVDFVNAPPSTGYSFEGTPRLLKGDDDELLVCDAKDGQGPAVVVVKVHGRLSGAAAVVLPTVDKRSTVRVRVFEAAAESILGQDAPRA